MTDTWWSVLSGSREGDVARGVSIDGFLPWCTRRRSCSGAKPQPPP